MAERGAAGRVAAAACGVLAVLASAVAVAVVAVVPGANQPAAAASAITKVLWIWEENSNPDQLIGSCVTCRELPYLNELANRYGRATRMKAASFPSLPNYIAATSGNTWGIADDALPQKHPLDVPNLFGQLPPGQAKVFAETMPSNCQTSDGPKTDVSGAGFYTVRRTGWPYYTNGRQTCQQNMVPMQGNFDQAVANGLPAFTEVVPATCNNFHKGGSPDVCQFGPNESYHTRADAWLSRTVPKLLAGPDWKAGRLAIFIMWDEGSGSAPVYGSDCTVSTLTGCRIPFVVLAPGVNGVVDDTPHTIYSVLRTTEEVLGLPLLGRAATATSLVTAFGLGAAPPATGRPPSRFVALSPTRVLDTRHGAPTFDGAMAGSGRVPPGGTVTVPITGRGLVPNDATAVVVNVTAINATAPGYVQVLPTDQSLIGASSNLNLEAAGQTVANLVVVPLGTGGRITIYSQGGADFAADAVGYYVASDFARTGRFLGVSPSRLLDTRGGAAFARGEQRSLTVVGRNGVPSTGVQAVVLNLTATAVTAPGFVQVVPKGGATAVGASSNLNVVGGQTRPNLVIVPVGNGGQVTLYNQAGGDLIVDVFGYVTDATAPWATTGLFVPLTPGRLLDTRGGSRPLSRSVTVLPPGGRQGVPAAGVSGVFLNVTATQAEAAGFVQVLPLGMAAIDAYSNLNVERPGQTVPNAVISPLGPSGELGLYTYAGTHLIADVAGYFSS